MLRPIGLDVVDLEHREKLMFSDFEKRVAFAFIHFFQIEEVLIKRDGLLKIVHFNRDVVNSVNLHAHRSHQSSHKWHCHPAIAGEEPSQSTLSLFVRSLASLTPSQRIDETASNNFSNNATSSAEDELRQRQVRWISDFQIGLLVRHEHYFPSDALNGGNFVADGNFFLGQRLV